MNSKTLTDVTSTTHPPCPPWCTSDYDYTDRFVSESHRVHQAGPMAMTLSDPGGEHTHKITLSLERYDYGGVLGEPVLHTAELVPDAYGRVRPVGLIPIPMSMATVRELGNALLALAAQDHTARPESLANKIDGPARGDDLRECDRCGCSFRPDSSPNLFLCWSCDEAEAGR